MLRLWRYSPLEDVPGTSGALKSKTKDKEKASSKHAPNGASVIESGAVQCMYLWARGARHI